MTMDALESAAASGRAGAKRDRLARFYRVVRFLEGRPEGATPGEIAAFVGVSRRTAYRDLAALEEEIGIPLWADDGRWGVDGRAFLPALRLTLAEATAVFLAARLMAKYADAYDPDLAGAFQKLAEALPGELGRHVERTLEVMARRPPDPVGARHLLLLVRGWAERRVVELTYDPSVNQPGRPTRTARVHPWLIEPSATTHALYLIGFDEARGAQRTFKVERIRQVTLTAEHFEPPAPGTVETLLERAWTIIADQGEVEVVLRFDPAAAGRVAEASWHPTQAIEPAGDGGLTWRATVSGTIEIRSWILGWGDEVEVLEPASLRDEVAALLERAAGRYRAR
jgi:proteasome accessory factor B